MRKSLLAVLVGVSISIGSVSPGYGVEAFLSIEGIRGEEMEPQHRDWMRVLSFNSDISQPASVMGPSRGQLTMSPITIVKFVDKATPLLALAGAEGRPLVRAVLEMLNAPGQAPYL